MPKNKAPERGGYRQPGLASTRLPFAHFLHIFADETPSAKYRKNEGGETARATPRKTSKACKETLPLPGGWWAGVAAGLAGLAGWWAGLAGLAGWLGSWWAGRLAGRLVGW